eukprot:6299988-Prymnesium_polylepis.1
MGAVPVAPPPLLLALGLLDLRHVVHVRVPMMRRVAVAGATRALRCVGQRLHTRVDSGSCGPQATWDRASQGAQRLAT